MRTREEIERAIHVQVVAFIRAMGRGNEELQGITAMVTSALQWVLLDPGAESFEEMMAVCAMIDAAKVTVH
jgi:hypothetical protein